jgi:hypothetical protein
MTTIRRIYAYLLALAGLGMFLVAAANLAQLLLDLVLQAPLARTDLYVRDTVALNVAGAIVGLPVWLVHWLWINRTARSDPQERASTLRRLYVYTVLAVAMFFIAVSTSETLTTGFDALLGGRVPAPSLDAVIRHLPFTLIALGAWFAHWRIAAADRASVGENGGSATLRRWYIYGAALVGLLVLLVNAQSLVEAIWRSLVQPSAFVGILLARPAAASLVGLSVWLAHWIVLPARLPEVARRDDDGGVLRSVYLFLALAVAVVATLLGASQLLYYAVGRLLGVVDPGGVGGNILQAAAGPASYVLVYGAAWAYQRQALSRQFAAVSEGPRQAGVRQLYSYLVALVALSVLATGVAELLWTLVDVLTGTAGALNGETWREQVALSATLAIVGLPAWLLHWRPSPAQADERRALARRLYVYLSLIVAMLTAVGSVAAVVFELIRLALGGSFGADVATDLGHALAVASIAALVFVYHWRILRADAQFAKPEKSETPETASAIVEITAEDAASLSRALSALRSTGVQVTVRQPA